MSRDITTAFSDAITAVIVRPIVMAVAEFDSETLRFWNGVGEFVYDSNTYTGSGNLLRISEIVETQKTEARGMFFELSALPSSLVAIALDEEYQDRPVSVLFAALEEDNTVIADPFLYFKGKADVMEIEYGRETATIKLSAESDLIALGRINERRRTSEDQKIDYSTDTFFDQVPALQSKEIAWGKNA